MANVCPGEVEVPSTVVTADFSEKVDISDLGDGTYLYGCLLYTSDAADE